MAVHLPKGTRDFLPEQMNRRRYVLETVREVFVRYGFEALETPAFERIETLTGKYGEEGDRLIYKILRRGEGGKRGEVDLALRYDLTVPFARVLAMNKGLRLPFRRYQMQPVWRADRPQRGRFREFWQCDVDIAGTTAPTADAECLAVAHDSLVALGFRRFTVHLNDRRILASLARALGVADREPELLVALDKLDKIGPSGVSAELARRGFAAEAVAVLWDLLAMPEGNDARLDALAERLDAGGQEGVAVLRQVLSWAEALGVEPARVRVTPTLARGLDYYTGPVYEVVVDEPAIGSIAGGGRYDGLIGLLSGRDVPAVGVALGIERIMAVMDELGMFPDRRTEVEVLVTVFGADLRYVAVAAARALRDRGVRTELYPEDRKLKAQFKHADARGVGWAVVIGPDEASSGTMALRNLTTGEQQRLSPAAAADQILAARGAAQ